MRTIFITCTAFWIMVGTAAGVWSMPHLVDAYLAKDHH